MHALRKLTLVAALAAVGACGSDGVTAANMDETLDPTLIETQTSDLQTVYTQPAMASLLFMSDMGGAPLSVNQALQRTSERIRSSLAGEKAKRPARVALALATYEPAIPADARGSIFVFDEVESVWVLDDSRSGPTDGVRFMLRGLDVEGNLTDTEIGYVEIRDLTTASQYRIVTTLRAGSLTVLSFDERESGDEGVNYSSSFAGYITDGTHRLDLSDVYTEQAVGDSYRGVENFTWTTRSGASFRAQSVWGETTATDKSWFEVNLGGTKVRFETPFVYDEEWGGYWEGNVTNIYANGRLFAVATYDPETGESTVTQPDGEPLTPEHAEGLANLGFVVSSISETIYMPYWIIYSLVGNIGAPVLQ
jgi:hypothetical protein